MGRGVEARLGGLVFEAVMLRGQNHLKSARLEIVAKRGAVVVEPRRDEAAAEVLRMDFDETDFAP